MTRSMNTDSYGNAGNWLIDTAKRNPEALLVLAAGCALLLRNGGKSQSPARLSGSDQRYADAYYEDFSDRVREGSSDQARSWRQGVSGAAESVKDYASNITERVSDAASSYASTVSHYADDGRRMMSRQASRLQSRAGRLWQEQPLAVLGLGLAAGAAMAAFLPATELEQRALGPARDALGEAAGQMQERLTEAAGEAGERLKQTAADRGLNAEGLKDMARDVAQSFTSKVSGDAPATGSPSMVPNNPTSESVGGGSR